MNVNYAAHSDKGDVRDENQDSALCLVDECSASALFAVADGMGGLQYGAEVSCFVTDELKNWWINDYLPLLSDKAMDIADMSDLFEQAIWEINSSIRAYCTKRNARCGSTLSLLLLSGHEYRILNIGDSRIYLKSDEDIVQLTEDQSYVAEMVKSHQMSEDEALKSNKKNVLTMCLGMFDEARAYSTGGIANDGDIFLICSDGLYRALDKMLMARIVCSAGNDIQSKVMMLRKSVLPGMARDNVTVILIETMASDRKDIGTNAGY